MMRLLSVAITVAGASVAAAEPSVAKRLFDEGRTQYVAGKYVEACVLFERSYELDPAVGTRLNVAECAERAGKYRAAWLLYTEAADEYDRTDRGNQAKFARTRADALAPKLATVVVHVARPVPPRLKIRIGSREIAGAADIVERVDPGTIEIVARAPGHESTTKIVEAQLGASVDVEIGALTPTEDPEPQRPWRTAAYVAGGATVVMVGTWFYAIHGLAQTGGSFPTYGERCTGLVGEPSRCGSGPQLQTIANITAIGAVVGMLATTAFIVQTFRTRPRSSGVAIAPIVTPDGAAVAIGVRW